MGSCTSCGSFIGKAPVKAQESMRSHKRISFSQRKSITGDDSKAVRRNGTRNSASECQIGCAECPNIQRNPVDSCFIPAINVLRGLSGLSWHTQNQSVGWKAAVTSPKHGKRNVRVVRKRFFVDQSR